MTVLFFNFTSGNDFRSMPNLIGPPPIYFYKSRRRRWERTRVEKKKGSGCGGKKGPSSIHVKED